MQLSGVVSIAVGLCLLGLSPGVTAEYRASRDESCVNMEDRAAHWRDALRQSSADPSSKANDELNLSAFRSFCTGDDDAALRLFDKVLKADSENLFAMRGRAIVHGQQGLLAVAIDDWGLILRLVPTDQAALLARGLAQLESGAFDKAMEDAAALLRIDAHSADGHFLMGMISSDRGSLAESVSWFDKAVQLDPQSVHARHNRGIALSKMGRHDLALQDYNFAVEHTPDGESLYNMLANRSQALEGLGKYEQAFSDVDRAIGMRPGQWLAHNLRGIYYVGVGRKDAAMVGFSDVIRVAPQEPFGYTNRGRLHLEMGDPVRAVADLSAALSLKPSHVPALIQRGLAWSAMGEGAKAEADFTKAIDTEPNNPRLRRLRSMARSNLGKFEAASVDADEMLRLQTDTDVSNAVLFRYFAKARAGGREEALRDLASVSASSATNARRRPIAELVLAAAPEEFLTAVERSLVGVPPSQECQSRVFLGRWALTQQRLADARSYFSRAMETCGVSMETDTARTELKRISSEAAKGL